MRCQPLAAAWWCRHWRPRWDSRGWWDPWWRPLDPSSTYRLRLPGPSGMGGPWKGEEGRENIITPLYLYQVSTVECHHNAVQYNMILHRSTHESEFAFITDSPYLALMGELWGVCCCEEFGENWPRYNGTALYFVVLPYTWNTGDQELEPGNEFAIFGAQTDICIMGELRSRPADDDRSACIASSSVAMLLTMHDKLFLVFHKEGFQLPATPPCWEMAKNANIFLCFLT